MNLSPDETARLDEFIVGKQWLAAIKLCRNGRNIGLYDAHEAIMTRNRHLREHAPELFSEERDQWEAARKESWAIYTPVRMYVHAIVVLYSPESDFPGPRWVEIIASPEGEYRIIRLPTVPNLEYAEQLAAELAEHAKVTVTSRSLPIY